MEVFSTTIRKLEANMVGFDGPPKLNLETDGENPEQVFQYRVLRYAPNIVEDKCVNIGVVV